jgi:hypothetical protein
MIQEAMLRRRDDGRYVYTEPQKSDAEDLGQWLGDAAGGLTITPAPDVAARRARAGGVLPDRLGGQVRP